MAGPFRESFGIANKPGWDGDLTWTTTNGVPYVISQQAVSQQPGAGTSTNASAYVTSGELSSSPNAETRVYVNTMELSVESMVGVTARVGTFGNENNSYQFFRIGAATLGGFGYFIRKSVNGVPTTLVSPVVYPRAGLSTPETIKLQVVSTAFGMLLTCFIDEIQVASYVDGTNMITNGTAGGLIIRSAAGLSTFAENWSFGDIGTTGGPKAFTAKSGTASSSKAVVNLGKIVSAKAGASTSARSSVLGVRSTRQTKISSASGMTGTLITVTEGFKVLRPLVVKGRNATSLTAALSTERAVKFFAGKWATASSAKAIERNILSYQSTLSTTSSSAKGVLKRAAAMDGLVFQSDSATAHLTGRVFLNVNVSNVSSIIAGMSGGRNTFEVIVPLGSSDIYVIEFTEAERRNIFVCPMVLEDPPTYPYHHPGNRLFRHYRPRPAGRNVYIYSNNTVSESDPDGYSTLWRESDRTSDTLANAPHVTHVFWGGHEAEAITSQERSLLVAAGYTTGTEPI